MDLQAYEDTCSQHEACENPQFETAKTTNLEVSNSLIPLHTVLKFQ